MTAFKILAETDAYLAIYKPAGLPTNILEKSPGSPSLEKEVLAQHPDVKLLHRLDPETSGLVLFAKSPEIFAQCREAWNTPRVEKTYLARVSPSDAPAIKTPLTVRNPIGHSAKSDRKMLVAPDLAPEKDWLRRIRGQLQPAETVFLESLDDRGLFRIQIKTGVRHQIRVHAKYLGLPLLGDDRYGGAASSRLHLQCEGIRILVSGAEFSHRIPADGDL
jgi:23S rRNA-/tRNA-specific pseudouridylate synthase